MGPMAHPIAGATMRTRWIVLVAVVAASIALMFVFGRRTPLGGAAKLVDNTREVAELLERRAATPTGMVRLAT